MRALTHHPNGMLIFLKIHFVLPTLQFLKLGCGWSRHVEYRVARRMEKGPTQDPNGPEWDFGGL